MRNNLVHLNPEALKEWEAGVREWVVREAYVLQEGHQVQSDAVTTLNCLTHA